MNSTEEYLDRLLRGVTGEPEPEPEVVAEPEIIEQPAPIEVVEEPTLGITQENIEIPNVEVSEIQAPPVDIQEETSDKEDVPVATEEISFVEEDMPVIDEIPIENIPVVENIPVAEELPVVEEAPAPEPMDNGMMDPADIEALFAAANAEAATEAVVEETPIENIPVVEEIPAIEEMPVVEETPAPAPMDNGMMDPADIEALFAAANAEAATEAVVEDIPIENIPVVEEIPAAEETPAPAPMDNGMMDPADIEALFAAANADAATEVPAEEAIVAEEMPVAEETPAPEPMDNGMMDPADIEALFAAANAEAATEAVVEETPIENIPAVEEIPVAEETPAPEPMDNGMMDPADIEALFAAANAEAATEAVVEETPIENIPAVEEIPAAEETPAPEPMDNGMMDPADIEALFAAANAEAATEEAATEETPAEETAIEDTVEPIAAEDEVNISIVDEAESLLSDLPELDIPLDDIEEESSTEISLDEIDITEPVAAESMPIEEVVEADDDSMPRIDDDIQEENYEDNDIASLLQDIENMGKEEAAASAQTESLAEDQDLEDLLASSDDSDMSEIGDILQKDENSIPVDDSLGDDFDFTSGMLSEDELFDNMEDILEDEDAGKKKKKKKVKKQKKNKESNEIEDEENKGPGFLARLLNALIASDDDDELEESAVKFEESAIDIAVEGAQENDALLAELEEEGKGKKKKKKDKKKKDKKGKAAKADGDDEEQTPKDAKQLEKERKKAEKARLKAERKAAEDALPKKKLPKKKVIPICILCFSFGVVITLLAFLMPSAIDKQKAQEQYDQHNYEATYSLLKGHSLSEKEQLMYDRTVTLLQEERKLDSYKNYMSLDMKPEALNALVQGVKKYEELSARATELEVMPELNGVYTQIVAELQNSFGVSVDKAQQWVNITDTEEYSYIINSYANGNGNVVIDGMEAENADVISNINVWDNSVISAEEAEIQ